MGPLLIAVLRRKELNHREVKSVPRVSQQAAWVGCEPRWSDCRGQAQKLSRDAAVAPGDDCEPTLCFVVGCVYKSS